LQLQKAGPFKCCFKQIYLEENKNILRPPTRNRPRSLFTLSRGPSKVLCQMHIANHTVRTLYCSEVALSYIRRYNGCSQ